MIPNTTRSPLLKKSLIYLSIANLKGMKRNQLYFYSKNTSAQLYRRSDTPLIQNKKKKGITRYEDCSTWVVACSSAIARSCHNNKQREPISTIVSRQQLRSQHCARAERDNVLYIVFSTILHYATQLDLFFSTNTFHFILIYRGLSF